MAKCDMNIARLYASLVPNTSLRDRIFGVLQQEFDRTVKMVLRVSGHSRLLEANPVLDRSIRLRNPYVDPMSLIQVTLLRRKRAGNNTEELNYALAATINGIAAGLQHRMIYISRGQQNRIQFQCSETFYIVEAGANSSKPMELCYGKPNT